MITLALAESIKRRTNLWCGKCGNMIVNSTAVISVNDTISIYFMCHGEYGVYDMPVLEMLWMKDNPSYNRGWIAAEFNMPNGMRSVDGPIEKDIASLIWENRDA